MPDTKLFAVTGSPIFNSKSPDIWNHTFDMLNIDANYFRIAADDIADAVKTAKEIGLLGMNITAPHKEEAIKFATELSKEVIDIGAANSFIFEGDKVKAVNTDWEAVYSILASKDLINMQGKKALVIGAGGAARAAIYTLKKCMANVTVTNRTEQKAKNLSSFFNFSHKTFAECTKSEYEVIVSCVPYSEEVLNKLKCNLLIDASYRGLKSTDKYVAGEEWLVLQGEAFFKKIFDAEPLPYMREGLNKTHVKKEHIALIGFMGAGKTFAGKMLAKELGYDFIDVDALIEQQAGVSISEIFNTKGVEHFRALEKQMLVELNLDVPTVVATGGGVIIDADNRAILKKNFSVVWLWADISTARSRAESGTRPLFTDDAIELLKQRTALYAETCDICISNCHRSLDEVINKIKLELN